MTSYEMAIRYGGRKVSLLSEELTIVGFDGDLVRLRSDAGTIYSCLPDTLEKEMEARAKLTSRNFWHRYGM